MLRFPAKKTTRPKIHLTALIDIIFLLLIFFLLASSFIHQQGVVIVVPEVESQHKDDLPDLIVKIDHQGGIYFNDVSMDENELLYWLKKQIKRTSLNTVLIQADRRVQYDKVVQVIDISKLAGAKNLLLLTKRVPQNFK